jgi:hypothetical protein
MFSLEQGLESAWSTGETEAVQYFQSQIGEGGSSSLLTDLSIGFQTLEQLAQGGGSTSDQSFSSMASAFFKTGSLASVAAYYAEVGLDHVLDFMQSAVNGSVITGTTDQNFTSNAYNFFNTNAN